MAAPIAIFLAALLLAFGFAFAAHWLVIVPIAIDGLRRLARLAPGRTPHAVRRTKKPQLPGPGGPDDPRRLSEPGSGATSSLIRPGRG